MHPNSKDIVHLKCITPVGEPTTSCRFECAKLECSNLWCCACRGARVPSIHSPDWLDQKPLPCRFQAALPARAEGSRPSGGLGRDSVCQGQEHEHHSRCRHYHTEYRAAVRRTSRSDSLRRTRRALPCVAQGPGTSVPRSLRHSQLQDGSGNGHLPRAFLQALRLFRDRCAANLRNQHANSFTMSMP